jgi:hypothetical protein
LAVKFIYYGIKHFGVVSNVARTTITKLGINSVFIIHFKTPRASHSCNRLFVYSTSKLEGGTKLLLIFRILFLVGFILLVLLFIWKLRKRTFIWISIFMSEKYTDFIAEKLTAVLHRHVFQSGAYNVTSKITFTLLSILSNL